MSKNNFERDQVLSQAAMDQQIEEIWSAYEAEKHDVEKKYLSNYVMK